MTSQRVFKRVCRYIEKKYGIPIDFAELKGVDAIIIEDTALLINKVITEWDARLAALLHELGHLELSTCTGREVKKNEVAAEVFAAYVMFHLGFIQTMVDAFDALDDWEVSPAQVRGAIVEVQKPAQSILGMILDKND